jgi:hypothetical protein
MRRFRTSLPLLGWVLAGVLAVALGGRAVAATLAPEATASATAAADSSGQSGQEQPQAQGDRGDKGGRGWHGRGHRGGGPLGGGRFRERAPVRGEVTVPNGSNGYEQVAFARGTVTAISETSISVRSADNVTTTFALNGDTTYRKGRDEAARTDIAVNAEVFVSGPRSGSTLTARHVIVRGDRNQGRPGPSPTPTPAPPAPTPTPTP